MTVPCVNPVREEPDAELPEGWDEWRESETCTHDHCVEVDGWSRQYAAERPYRESLELARRDLDMPYADERHLNTAIYLRLK
jgi:hypothetical protein